MLTFWLILLGIAVIGAASAFVLAALVLSSRADDDYELRGPKL